MLVLNLSSGYLIGMAIWIVALAVIVAALLPRGGVRTRRRGEC